MGGAVSIGNDNNLVIRNSIFLHDSIYLGAMTLCSLTSNSNLFGIPLEGTAHVTALNAELRNTGVIVIDGSVSLIDAIKIKNKPFVDDIIIYSPFLYGFDREILPDSTTQFFNKHPEARYWE